MLLAQTVFWIGLLLFSISHLLAGFQRKYWRTSAAHVITLVLGTEQLMTFNSLSHAKGTEDNVHYLNMFQMTLGFEDGGGACHAKKQSTFWECPVVWDTGTSFGLTPFYGDFIDCVECKIQVNDIARTNMVIGIGTTLHKFTESDGETAKICLFSPQTYHTLMVITLSVWKQT